MPIDITPVNLVNIDLSSAQLGDGVKVTFTEGGSIFLVVVEQTRWDKSSALELALTTNLMTPAIYIQLVGATQKILRPEHYLKEWWDKLCETKGATVSDIFTELLDSIISGGSWVGGLQHGENLQISYSSPIEFLSHELRELLQWTAPHPIMRIEAVSKWDLDLAAGLLQADRLTRGLARLDEPEGTRAP